MIHLERLSVINNELHAQLLKLILINVAFEKKNSEKCLREAALLRVRQMSGTKHSS